MLLTNNVLATSGVAFGTSGARGLVSDFTSDVCAAFTHAFLNVMKQQFDFKQLAIAIDNRPSSQQMAQACATALLQAGIEPIYYGVLPTPALAFTAMQDNIPCIMVTGSHIPFDRNGLKFYRPDGEISKADEQAILSVSAQFESLSELTSLKTDITASLRYVARYTSLFGRPWLEGKRIGVYEHSSSGRDLYADLFKKLGADVVCLERSDEFVPIDTEAVSDADKDKAKIWSKQYQLDAIFSTDGDGDRPLIADEQGEWLRGDILGLLCAKQLNIEALAVPVSCNSAIEQSGIFTKVIRTRIGSPHVIAEFTKLSADYTAVAGFEANGGFLLGSDLLIDGEKLHALPTRDAVLPALMVLRLSESTPLSHQVAQLPQSYTYSDRLTDFATEKSQQLITEGQADPITLLNRLGYSGIEIQSLNTIDGLRVTLENNDVIHLRPSGNAPELRCYAQATSTDIAKSIVLNALDKIASF